MSMLGDFGFDFSFDMNEAIAPPDRSPVPAGPYPVVLVDMNPDKTDSGYTILRMQFKVEGGEYNDRVIYDDWFMPNKALQEPKKYKEALGYLQEKLQALYGQPVVGNINLNPMELLGRRCIVQVYVVSDKQIDKETGEPLRNEAGAILTYPPKNRIRKYLPIQQVAAQAPQAISMAQPVAPQAQPVPQPVQQMVAPQAPPQAAPVAQPTAPQPVAAAPTPAPAPSEPQQAPAPVAATDGESTGAAAFKL